MTSVTEGMKEYDLRMMANEIYFEMMNDLRWYTRRGGNNGKVTKKVLDIWVRLMTPITPHTAEELWSLIGNETFVSTESLPEVSENDVFPDVEEAEEF
jgi:leucyl-tRNA synthetase